MEHNNQFKKTKNDNLNQDNNHDTKLKEKSSDKLSKKIKNKSWSTKRSHQS